MLHVAVACADIETVDLLLEVKYRHEGKVAKVYNSYRIASNVYISTATLNISFSVEVDSEC